MKLKKFKEFINEDIFYEPEQKDIDYTNDIEEIINNIIDQESEWVIVKRGGKDIEVGTRTYTNGEGKRVTPKFDGNECRELADSVILSLEDNGFGIYQLSYIGQTSFGLIKK